MSTTGPTAPLDDRTRRVLVRVGWSCALLATVLAVALPVLPVRVSTPVIHWPAPGAPVESTTVLLTNQLPRDIEVTVPCAVVERTDGTILSTTNTATGAPTIPSAMTLAGQSGELVVRVPEIGAETGAEPLVVRVPVPRGTCDLIVRVDADGLTVRDGDEVLGVETRAALPFVSSLRTDLDPEAAAGLSARLTVVDDGNVTRTALKTVVLALALLALLVAGWCGWAAARRAGPTGGVRTARPRRPRPPVVVADLVLLVVAVTWFVIAPLGDDDSWIMQMARNYPAAGFVGEYYYIFNGSHAPFDWWWRFLSLWLGLGNPGVLWMRVPALVAGVAAWVLVRRFVVATLGPLSTRRLSAALVAALVAYLAWWLPFGMVLRVEAIQPLLVMTVLTLVARSLERGSLGPIAGAAAVAGVAFATHPNGATALAPLIVAAAPIWRLCRAGVGRLGGLARLVWVASPLALAAVIGFSAASLGSYRRNQELYAYVGRAEYWYDEWKRYEQLFTGGTLGSYARALPVLMTLLAISFFLVAYFVSRQARLRRVVPVRMVLSGWSAIVALAALAIVPSKFTHHFGTLIGLGAVVVAIGALTAAPLIRAVRRALTVPAWVPAVALVLVAATSTLALRGPNTWWGAWYWGLGGSDRPPAIRGIPLDSLAVWLAVAAAVVLVVALMTRDRPRDWTDVLARSIPGLVLLVGLTAVGYTLGRWTQFTAATAQTWSAPRANLEDPSSSRCSAASAVTVWLPQSATPLVAVDGSTAPRLDPAELPPGLDGMDAFTTAGPALTSGEVVAASPWYALATPGAGGRTVVYVSGDLSAENDVTVELGREEGGTVRPIGSEVLSDGLTTRQWRGLDVATDDVAGATVMRVVAHDVDAEPGAQISFTGPSNGPGTLLRDAPSAGATVATPWQNAMLFPCWGDVATRDGVTERIDDVVSFLDQDGVRAFSISSFPRHGGLYVPSEAEASGRVALVTDMVGAPLGSRWGGFELLSYDVPDGRYEVDATRTTTPGWTIPWIWPQSESTAG